MAQFFRANAGAVICNAGGQVLALERSDVPGAWQLPQGGLDAGEEPDAAVLREVEEETGLSAASLEPIRPYPEPLAYELPPELRSAKTGRGQVQYWFYFRLRPGAGEPRLPSEGEFRDWQWVDLGELARSVVEFRRPVYARLADYLERDVRPQLGGG